MAITPDPRNSPTLVFGAMFLAVTMLAIGSLLAGHALTKLAVGASPQRQRRAVLRWVLLWIPLLMARPALVLAALLLADGLSS